MKVSFGFVSSLLLSGASIASAAAWSFEDATVSIASKGAGVGGASKDKYVQAAIQTFTGGSSDSM
jgi:oligosaccharyltransferase complex subunit delta (ribophorin II)